MDGSFGFEALEEANELGTGSEGLFSGGIDRDPSVATVIVMGVSEDEEY